MHGGYPEEAQGSRLRPLLQGTDKAQLDAGRFKIGPVVFHVLSFFPPYVETSFFSMPDSRYLVYLNPVFFVYGKVVFFDVSKYIYIYHYSPSDNVQGVIHSK